jgi:hypothetical protein
MSSSSKHTGDSYQFNDEGDDVSASSSSTTTTTTMTTTTTTTRPKARSLYSVGTLNAYQRHQQYIRDYVMFYGGSDALTHFKAKPGKTDLDVLSESHQYANKTSTTMQRAINT